MAAPSSVDEFLDLVRKSCVVDEKRLNPYLQKLRTMGNVPQDLGKFAGVLVRDGILTHFQAEQFLQGKWRRFTIGKYKVLERLGSGGMGSVYLCEHKFMRRRVAVKVLPAAKADDPSALERFYREARAVAALDHPNIVRAYDIDQDEKLHFLVMEYVDGSSLQEMVKKHGPMDVTRTAHYVSQSGIGLQHAHVSAGLVHRDIKPGNVLVDRNGVVKILDMGLARFFHDEEDVLTKKYDENVLGTADYLAPEQALDSHSVDIRADIYSLGATFYFMLSGNTPFTEGTVAQKLIWHQTRQPKPIKQLRPEVPDGLVSVLEKMMAKKPEDRYQTPSDIVQALAPWTQTPIPPPPEKEMPRLSPAAMGDSSSSQHSSMTAATPPPFPIRATPAPPPRAPAPPAPAQERPAAISRPANPPPRPAATMPAPAVAAANASTPSPQNTPKPAAVRPAPPPRADNGRAPVAPVPSPAPVAKVEEAPNWGQIAPAQDNSKVRRSGTSEGLPQVWTHLRKTPYFWFFALGAVGTVFLFLAILVAVAYFWPKKPGRTSSKSTGAPTVLFVSLAKPGGFKNLQEALKVAKAGDKIVIEEEKIEDQFVIEDSSAQRQYARDLTIESGREGKPVTWICPDKPRDGRFVSLANVEGLKLKGFVFDAQNRSLEAVRISGHCPGLTLEDVHLVNFSRTGLLVTNCNGNADAPVTFTRLRVSAGSDKENAVYLHARQTMPANQFLTFSACTFEGPYKAAIVLIEGPLSDVEFKRSRFFNAETAFFYKTGGKPHSRIDLSVDSNTFANIRQRGVFLEDVLNFSVKNKLTLKNNLFSQTAVLAFLDRYPVQPGGSKPAGLTAKWIWLNDATPAAAGSRCFRRTFTPGKKVMRATLDVGVAGGDFTVWINGKPLEKQPAGRVVSHDVSSQVHAGKNVIAVMSTTKEVVRPAPPLPSAPTPPAGFIVQLTFLPDGGQPVKLGSDQSWKSSSMEAAGWQSVDFNDQGWAAARVVAEANASSPFQGFSWDAATPDAIRTEYKTVFEFSKNVRDRTSREGNVDLDAVVVDFPPLPNDPTKPDFLVYPANSPLNQLADKPGVPPS